MSSPDPLQRLRDLERSSVGFSDRLIDILLMGEWTDQAQNLPPNDLRELIEYLDSVRVRIAFTRLLLSGVVGPRDPRSHHSRFLSLFVRTSKDLRHLRSLTNITLTLVPSFGREQQSGHLWNFGRHTQGDPQWLGGSRQKGAGLLRR